MVLLTTKSSAQVHTYLAGLGFAMVAIPLAACSQAARPCASACSSPVQSHRESPHAAAPPPDERDPGQTDGLDDADSDGMPRGWSARVSSSAATVRRDDRERYAGAGSLTLAVEHENARAEAFDTPMPVLEGNSYVVAFWYRATGFNAAGFAGTSSTITFSWLDEAQHEVAHETRSFAYSALPWRRSVSVLAAPPKAHFLQISLSLVTRQEAPASAVWFDDLTVSKLPAPSSVSRKWTYRMEPYYDPFKGNVVTAADDESRTGWAKSARVGITHNPAYLAGNFRTEEQPPGRYRALFRLKVADNSRRSPAFEITVSDELSPLHVVARDTVLCSDFTRAGVYQELTLPFVILPGERGKLDFTVKWLGNADGWLDYVAVEQQADTHGFTPPVAASAFDADASFFAVSAPQAHLTIDEARYSTPSPSEPASSHSGISREAYWDVIHALLERRSPVWQAWLAQREPYPKFIKLTRAAMFSAFLWRARRDDAAAHTALALLDQLDVLISKAKEQALAPPQNFFFALFAAHQAKEWLSDHPGFGKRQRDILRRLALTIYPAFPSTVVERGAFNRAMYMALAGRELLDLVPDAPGAHQWKTYIDAAWSDWWTLRDTTENSGNYNALFLRLVLDWVSQTGIEASFWRDARVRQLFERFLEQVAPLGTLPHYGDTPGWNVEWGHWVRIFETAASGTRDPRFKWAAHRIFEYGITHIEDIDSWTYTGEDAIESLMLAYLSANERIAERAPTEHLSILSRTAITQTPGEPNPDSRFVLTSGRIPDKLVFRGGFAPNDGYAMFELAPACVHHRARAPALTALIDGGSVLLFAEGYRENLPEDHNALLIDEYEGIRDPSLQEKRIEVLDSARLGAASAAVVEVERYQGLPATTHRSVLFVNDGPTLIRDDLTVEQSFALRAGSSFRVQNVGPEIGETWVNTYVGDWIPVRGIGRGTPVYSRWKNPPRDLLIYFVPHPDRRLEVVDYLHNDPTNTHPKRVSYVWRGKASVSDSPWFTTLLIPHDPQRHPSQLANAVHVELDDAATSVLRVEQDGEMHWLLLNEGGKLIHAGGLETDAKQGYLRTRDGNVVTGSLRDVRSLSLGGQQLIHERTRRDRELSPPAN